jgi:hypothetical protein
MNIRNAPKGGSILVKVLNHEINEDGSFDTPDELVEIDEDAFVDCVNLKRVKLYNNLICIGFGAFAQCENIEQMDIPDSVTKINAFAFQSCRGLKRINLGTGLVSIGGSAFDGCENLTEVTLPEGLSSIGMLAFDRCIRLKKINLPMGLTTIRFRTFQYCFALEEIDIPLGVTAIESLAFKNCTALKQISLPEGIQTIAEDAFLNSGLETIFIDSRDEKERARIINLLPNDLKDKVVSYTKFELFELLGQKLSRIIGAVKTNPLHSLRPFLIHSGLPFLPNEILVKINEELGSDNLCYQKALTAIKAVPLPKAQSGEKGKRAYEAKIEKIVNDCIINGEPTEETNYSFLLKAIIATAAVSGLTLGVAALVTALAVAAIPVATTLAVASAVCLTVAAGTFFYHSSIEAKEAVVEVPCLNSL